MPVDLINLDQEKIYRTLMNAELDPKVIEVLIELHETQRAMQKLVNELMEHQSKIIQALPLINESLKGQMTRLQQIERRYSDPHKDLIDATRQ